MIGSAIIALTVASPAAAEAPCIPLTPPGGFVLASITLTGAGKTNAGGSPPPPPPATGQLDFSKTANSGLLPVIR